MSDFTTVLLLQGLTQFGSIDCTGTLTSYLCCFIFQQIPTWWIWCYYLTPTSWTLNGMLTSQYGDINKEIVVFGETKTVSAFLKDYFGFHHNELPLVAVISILYPMAFAFLFAYCIGKFNFQKR